MPNSSFFILDSLQHFLVLHIELEEAPLHVVHHEGEVDRRKGGQQSGVPVQVVQHLAGEHVQEVLAPPDRVAALPVVFDPTISCR